MIKKTSFLVSVLVFTLIVTSLFVSAKKDISFSDVAQGSWYENPVMNCYERGYMSGTSESTFSPSSEFTRAMAVTVLSTMSGEDKTPYANRQSFTDVPKGKWYSASVEWAYEKGIVGGYGGGRFGPDDPVTRQQLAVILKSYRSYTVRDTSGRCEDMSKFGDSASISSWAYEAMSWAVSERIMSGDKSENLLPCSYATRAQFAVMLNKMTDRLVCVYYDGLWDVGLNMTEDDFKSADMVYYLSLYVKGDATVSISNATLSASAIRSAKQINPSLKVLVTLCGENRSGNNGTLSFANAVSTAGKRTLLCENVMKYVRDYGFDGVDINWEYPQNVYDMENEVLFAKELRSSLKANDENALLTAAVPATNYAFETHDMLGLLPSVDYFNVMTYDFHINDIETLHHTAPRNDATGKYRERGYSCEKTVELLEDKGIPSSKMIIGCGLYTLEWAGVPAGGQNGFNSTGVRVRNRTYHYNGLQGLMKSGYVRYWDDTAKAAYWYNADTKSFLSCDDDESVREKAKILYETDCAGLMMFSYRTFKGGTLLHSTREWADGNFEYPASIYWQTN